MKDYFFTEVDKYIRERGVEEFVTHRQEVGHPEDDIWREIVERIRYQLNDAFDHIKHTYLEKLGDPQYLVGLGNFIFHKISLCETAVQKNSFYRPVRAELFEALTYFKQRLIWELPALLPSVQVVPVDATQPEPQTGSVTALLPPQEKQKYKGFMYNNTDNSDKHLRLASLRDRLRASNLIDDVNLAIFKRVFLEVEIHERINWTGTISQLRYFLNRLLDADDPLLDFRYEKWQTTAKCFTVSGKEISDLQLRHTKDPSAQNKEPVDAAIHELEWR